MTYVDYEFGDELVETAKSSQELINEASQFHGNYPYCMEDLRKELKRLASLAKEQHGSDNGMSRIVYDLRNSFSLTQSQAALAALCDHLDLQGIVPQAE